MSTNQSALLVMDMQSGIVSRYIEQPKQIEPLQRAIAAAREEHIPVLFVRVAFREGYPEVSPANKSFSAISDRGGMGYDDAGTQIDASMEPMPGELVIEKKRISAFAGSDLEMILRAKGINTLILSGIATSGVVLSTVREAADKDFRLKVLSDACIDADEEVHRVLMEKVFPRQADVLSAGDWIVTLK